MELGSTTGDTCMLNHMEFDPVTVNKFDGCQ